MEHTFYANRSLYNPNYVFIPKVVVSHFLISRETLFKIKG